MLETAWHSVASLTLAELFSQIQQCKISGGEKRTKWTQAFRVKCQNTGREQAVSVQSLSELDKIQRCHPDSLVIIMLYSATELAFYVAKRIKLYMRPVWKALYVLQDYFFPVLWKFQTQTLKLHEPCVTWKEPQRLYFLPVFAPIMSVLVMQDCCADRKHSACSRKDKVQNVQYRWMTGVCV